jgi:hypothetical protein
MKDAISTTRNPGSFNIRMDLRIVLSVHAVLTLAAGVVLIGAPDLIPNAVGIRIEPRAYLLCYLLAASELGLAALSWGGRSLKDIKALRLVAITCVVFHASSGILEVYAFAKGVSVLIWGNIALRAVAVLLFVFFGLYKMPKDAAAT